MFQRYLNPDDVGWLGWFEDAGEVEAFVTLDRRVMFVHEIKGWDAGDAPDPPDPPDSADWWKER